MNKNTKYDSDSTNWVVFVHPVNWSFIFVNFIMSKNNFSIIDLVWWGKQKTHQRTLSVKDLINIFLNNKSSYFVLFFLF